MVRLVGAAMAAICWSITAAEVDRSKLPPAASARINFVEHIKPIFEESCHRCHGAEKPKGGFSLTSKESALKGGGNGAAIIPGDSINSPLIWYVARLVEDMEMPPLGKGEPLTTEQVGLLRAWIDQGAEWSDEPPAPSAGISVTPAFRWITISGDKQEFREHHWMHEGANIGIEGFRLRHRTNDNIVTIEGRAFPVDEDYRVSLRYDRTDIGFVHVGYDQFRKYHDDSGGFYPFAQSNYSLNRNLYIEQGKAWAEIGLMLPHWPKLALGYEYQFREGTKSTLQWGSVKTTSAPILPVTSVERHIYPAFKDVNEDVHILKLDASHEVAGIRMEENFRAEFYNLGTHRVDGIALTQGQGTPSRSVLIDEGHNQFQAVNTFHLSREIREWWFIHGGYLYSASDADASFNQNTMHATGLPISGDFWKSQSLIFTQNAHVFSVQTRLGPWQDVVLLSGVQSEWFHQEGVGNVSLDTGNPATILTLEPATIDANFDKHVLTENVKLSFGKIPYTTLFAEGKLEQESIGQFESQVGAGHDFLRDTDADADLRDLRAGFYSAPWRQVSLGGNYRNRHKETRYNHRVDLAGGAPGDSYPAFIRSRTMDTDEVEAKLTLRPAGWLRTTFSYQITTTEIDSATDGIAGVTPGGGLRAANIDADVYGLNLVFTPFRRWYLSGTFNYYDSRMEASHNNVPSVVPYRGNVISAFGSVTFTLNEKTDLNGSYSFSCADYAQNNFTAGLPVGMKYDRHELRAGIRRKFKHVTANLEYAQFRYEEPSNGGFNDYRAHAVFATMTFGWP